MMKISSRLSYVSAASIKEENFSRPNRGEFLLDNGATKPVAIRRIELKNTTLDELNELRNSSSDHPNILRCISYELRDNFLYIGYNTDITYLTIVEAITTYLYLIFY